MIEIDYLKLIEDVGTSIYNSVCKLIKNAPFDKSFRAQVTKSLGNDKYEVLYKGNVYTVKCKVDLSVGDFVTVCASQNNWNELVVTEISTAVNRELESINDSLEKINASLTQLNSDLTMRKIKTFSSPTQFGSAISDSPDSILDAMPNSSELWCEAGGLTSSSWNFPTTVATFHAVKLSQHRKVIQLFGKDQGDYRMFIKSDGTVYGTWTKYTMGS